jgi:Pyruvate/2-oxoacid:ferredoxin oxidoreductase delta subunit
MAKHILSQVNFGGSSKSLSEVKVKMSQSQREKSKQCRTCVWFGPERCVFSEEGGRSVGQSLPLICFGWKENNRERELKSYKASKKRTEQSANKPQLRGDEFATNRVRQERGRKKQIHLPNFAFFHSVASLLLFLFCHTRTSFLAGLLSSFS